MAKLAKLYPADDFEALIVDSIISTVVSDFYLVISRWMRATDTEEATKTFNVEFPDMLEKMNKYVEKIKQENQWIVKEVSIADMLVFEMLYIAKTNVIPCPKGLMEGENEYPTLEKIYNQVYALPQVKKLIDIPN